MLSAVCYELRPGRRICLALLLGLSLLMQLLMSCQAGRINRAAFMDGDVHSELVDPNNSTIWNMFNLTREQVNRIRTTGNNAAARDETTQNIQKGLFDHVRDHRMNQLREQIRNAVSNKQEVSNGSQAGASSGDASQAPGAAGASQLPEHVTAAYPACNGETTIADWQHLPNLTLQFASDWFHYGGPSLKLNSAVLRLYKVNPKANQGAVVQTVSAPPGAAAAAAAAAGEAAVAAAASTICPEPMVDSQLRFTVSIIHQQKKKRKLERKKRICNTMMLSSSTTGWVEMDVKCALNYWTQQQQHQQQHPHLPIVVGQLMIELHDDEDNQLLPGQYFMPPNCEQVTGPAIPWPQYGSATPLPGLENYRVPPKSPRLDVSRVGQLPMLHVDNSKKDASYYAELKKRLFNQQQSRSKEQLNNAESTTLNSPAIDNMLEQRSENDCLERAEQQLQLQHPHQHRRRHHHSEHQHSSSSAVASESESAMDASQQQAESQHHLRVHHSHHHHHHEHRLHGHHPHYNHHTHRQE